MKAAFPVREPSPRYFDGGGQSLRCRLCPRRCAIPPGRTGKCGVRANRGGSPFLPRHGYITALALDPIEKKPLYHFRPGSGIFSIGFAGCSLRCPFCQNWRISMDADAPGEFIPPEAVIARTKAAGVSQIAYTYSEPLVHAEYLLDCMEAARGEGIANVLVTNGSAEPEAAADILALTDAANIDLKCFSERTYREILGGSLAPVLEFIAAACRRGVHTELTTLVVPGLNDSEAELDRAADFIAGLSGGVGGVGGGKGEVPWHLSAYHPDYRWESPPTDRGKLAALAARAREKLFWVYTGNVGGKNDTLCRNCGETLVSRDGYRISSAGLVREEGSCRCKNCGEKAPVRF